MTTQHLTKNFALLCSTLPTQTILYLAVLRRTHAGHCITLLLPQQFATAPCQDGKLHHFAKNETQRYCTSPELYTIVPFCWKLLYCRTNTALNCTIPAHHVTPPHFGVTRHHLTLPTPHVARHRPNTTLLCNTRRHFADTRRS